MKKIFALAVLLTFLLSFTAFADNVQLPEIDSSYAVVYNTQSEKYLYDKKSSSIIYPASLTKIMTGLIACEYYSEHGNVTVTVTESALKDVQGNKVGLKAGEQVYFYDLIAALLVGSGNDAAYVIAETVGGTVDGFIEIMNEKAASLGMNNTNYSNPGGYHSPYMYTTLKDQVLLCTKTVENSVFMNISSLIKYDMPSTNLCAKRTFTNSNLLFDPNHWQRYYTENTSGFNVGMTSEAGWCMATSYDNDGQCEIIIVSGGKVDGYDQIYLEDVKKLIEYSSNAYSYVKIVDSKDAKLEVPVRLSADKDSLILATEKEMVALLPNGVDVSSEVTLETTLYRETFDAEIKAGEVFGKLSAYYEGELIGEVNLVALTSIKRSTWLWLVDIADKFFSNPYVKSTLLFLPSVAFALFTGFFIRFCIKKRRRAVMIHRAKLKNIHYAKKH